MHDQQPIVSATPRGEKAAAILARVLGGQSLTGEASAKGGVADWVGMGPGLAVIPAALRGGMMDRFLPLLKRIAYRKAPMSQQLHPDLVQEGAAAATKLFDRPTIETEEGFRKLATPTADFAMRNLLSRIRSQVLSEDEKALLSKVLRIESNLQQRLGQQRVPTSLIYDTLKKDLSPAEWAKRGLSPTALDKLRGGTTMASFQEDPGMIGGVTSSKSGSARMEQAASMLKEQEALATKTSHANIERAEEALGSLKGKQAEVAALMREGKTALEIGQALKLSRGRISNIQQELKYQLKKHESARRRAEGGQAPAPEDVAKDQATRGMRELAQKRERLGFQKLEDVGRPAFIQKTPGGQVTVGRAPDTTAPAPHLKSYDIGADWAAQAQGVARPTPITPFGAQEPTAAPPAWENEFREFLLERMGHNPRRPQYLPKKELALPPQGRPVPIEDPPVPYAPKTPLDPNAPVPRVKWFKRGRRVRKKKGEEE